MVNNKVNDSGNILFIDPNPKDNIIKTPEDFSISVELVTTKKKRAAIEIVKGQKTYIDTGSKKTKISFIDGSDVNSKEKALTTLYTEVGTNFNKENGDLETLGISNISIEFNSSYAPMITIDFVDIRGKLFEMGKDSPYSVFFELPFPIFELTVKGFYGSAVKYKLHLYKFNGKFNSSSGTFEVKCNFIGYTYAFLSDILIGYLKALPYTTLGGTKINELNALNQGIENNFLTFDELNFGIKKLNNDIKVLKNDNKEVKTLSLSSKLISSLNELKNDFIIDIVSILKGDNVESTEYNIINGVYNVLSDEKNNEKIIDYNKLIEDRINDLNKNEGGLGGKYPLNLSFFKVNENSNYFKNLNKVNFIGDYSSTNFKFGEDKYNKIKEAFQSISISNGKLVNIFIFSDAINDIQDKINKLNSDSKTTISSLGDDYFEMVKEAFPDGNFKSSIGDFFKILCDHVDIFLDVIRDVAVLAEKSEVDRAKQLEKLNFGNKLIKINGGVGDNIGSIKAFPDYREKNNDTLEDKWIGNLAPTMPEVILVEEILNGLIKSRIKDNETLDFINDQTDKQDWLPINPFDTLLYNKSNPYSILENDGGLYDYLRLTLYRFMILNSFSTNGLTTNELKSLGKLEANTVFNSIKNNQIKNVLNSTNLKEITDIFLNSTNVFNNYYTDFTKENHILKLNGDRYTYDYTPNKENGIFNIKNLFLPFRGNNKVELNGNNFNESDDLTKINDRENNGLKFLSDFNYKIQSSQVNNTENLYDNGATFIDIIEVSSYEQISPSFADYIKIGIDDNSPEILVVGGRTNANISGGGFGGKFGISDFNNIRFDSSVFPSNSLFSEATITTSSKNIFLTNFIDSPFFYVNNKQNNTESFFVVKDNNQIDVSEKNKKRGVKGLTSYFDIRTDKISNALNPKVVATDEFEILTINDLYSKIDNGKTDDIHIPFLNFTSGYDTLEVNITNFKEVYNYSLFGSDLYYNQNDYGKAFLLLSVLPLKSFKSFNLIDDNEYSFFRKEILPLFNYKGGFVEVPYSWILKLGSIIYRMENNSNLKYKIGTNENNGYSLVPNTEFNSDFPNIDELVMVLPPDGSSTNEFLSGGNKIDSIIKALPKQVKDKFSNEYKNWVIGDFQGIKNEFEIFKPSVTSNERYDFWVRLNKGLRDDPNTILNDNVLSDKFLENYNLILADYTFTNYNGSTINLTVPNVTQSIIDNNKGSFYNFFLGIKSDSNGERLLKNFIFETKIIVNATPKIWGKYVEINDNNSGVWFSKNNYELFFNSFFQTFNELNKDKSKNIEKVNEVKEQLFNSIDNDDIKLNIYKKLKLIYDKWVCGANVKYEDIGDELFKSFKFIDRGYNDIKDTFLINPVVMNEYLISSYNQSMYSYIGKVLPDNNIDFFALPSYINYDSPSELAKVFTPYPYNDTPKVSGPSFICMYIGERSSQLNLTDDDGSFVSDSFNVNLDSVNNTLDVSDVPSDMVSQGNTKLPVFMVNYGDDNQSIFNDIQLDQSEFTATDEYLTTVDELSNSRGIGQNLFDIYNTRAYTANIEMLGNAMIQPLMYFQLNGIPIFRGMYNIIKVKHEIKPNSMKTNFTGVRARKTKSKLVDKSTIFLNILGSLTDIVTDDVNLNSNTTTNTNLIFGNTSNVFSSATRGPKKSIECGIINKEVNNFSDTLKLVIDNLEGSYCSGGYACGDDKSKPPRSGETLWGLDRKNHSGPFDNAFWSKLDTIKNTPIKWKSNYPKPKDEVELFNLYSKVLENDYINFSKTYIKNNELKNIINNDGRILFNMIYAVFNGAGFFKGFAKLLENEYNNGKQTPDELLKVIVNERIGGAINAFKLGTNKNLNKASATLIGNTGIDISKMVGINENYC